jgi:hypothetical protein
MRNALALAAIVAVTAVSACGQAHGEDRGPTVSRIYSVGGFDSIELAGRYDVDVRTGANPSVAASGPEQAMERLVVEVRGGKLVIEPRRERRWFNFGNRSSGKGNVRVMVTVPTLTAASLAGSGNIRVDKVRGDRFEGDISGSGDLRLGTVDVAQLKLSIAGSGGLDAGSGRARSAQYDIAGAGDVRAAGIASEQLKVGIAGSGNVQARASGTADIDIVGSGNVEVTGGAKCAVSKAGSGNVRCS